MHGAIGPSIKLTVSFIRFIRQLSGLYSLDLKSSVYCLEALTEYFVDIPLKRYSTVSIKTGRQRGGQAYNIQYIH